MFASGIAKIKGVFCIKGISEYTYPCPVHSTVSMLSPSEFRYLYSLFSALTINED